MFLTRLKRYSESIRGEYQVGFRKGRSPIDQLESFEMCWRGMEFSWSNHVRNEILHRFREEEYPTYNKKKGG
jgi:hypothetical protein